MKGKVNSMIKRFVSFVCVAALTVCMLMEEVIPVRASEQADGESEIITLPERNENGYFSRGFKAEIKLDNQAEEMGSMVAFAVADENFPEESKAVVDNVATVGDMYDASNILFRVDGTAEIYYRLKDEVYNALKSNLLFSILVMQEKTTEYTYAINENSSEIMLAEKADQNNKVTLAMAESSVMVSDPLFVKPECYYIASWLPDPEEPPTEEPGEGSPFMELNEEKVIS